MATFALSITVPDAELPRVQTALKAYFANNGNPTPTNAQAQEAFRQAVILELKNIVKAYEQKQAAVGVIDTTPS